MTDITLKNFRCFGNEQTVPLAPLTFLVGENSTGKTSFMAMIRALWDLACNGDEPNFNRAPYSLGSFNQIVCDDFEEDKNTSFFGAGCTFQFNPRGARRKAPYHIEIEFKEDGSIPALNRLRVSHKDAWLECAMELDRSGREATLLCGASESIWEVKSPGQLFRMSEYRDKRILSYFRRIGPVIGRISVEDRRGENDASSRHLITRTGKERPSQADLIALRSLSHATDPYFSRFGEAYASAPVQSSPQRTYEVPQSIRDTEGSHVPQYLAYLFYREEGEWDNLKQTIEEFGRSSGLFDKIEIKKLGAAGGVPFQVEIGLSQNGMEVRNRNLIDVGYGVSQVLPVLTEVLRRDARHLFLFQQPEVHLHPRAQAALGSLFCNIVGKDRQIIVETHSDYILDRVRMDIRDEECELQHHDVAILYFDRSGSNVKIHPIKLDAAGNVVDPPRSYRRFFMQEINRLVRY